MALIAADNTPMIEAADELRRQTPTTDLIRSFMREKRVSGRRIAKALGYTESWFSQVMHNKRSLSVGELSKIAEVLGVHLRDLIPSEGEVRPPQTLDEIIERKILERLEALKK